MIRRGLGDRTCYVAMHKGSLSVCQVSAGVLTQPTPTLSLCNLRARTLRQV